ncbi:hypothetical protein [Clostridium perfringens]|uniref:hypothetical protein n=1 Tax=Clostridium perfringens TaxID=1502 RepID=UPI0024BCEE3F|nr:hypothetical protein [Clostridium perfringens]
MTKEQMYRKKFYKTVDYLENCSDVIVQNNCGVIIEKGICISESEYITYNLDNGTINLYVDCEEVLTIDENSPILSMFEGLIFSINEE